MGDELWKLSDEKFLPKQALKFYKLQFMEGGSKAIAQRTCINPKELSFADDSVQDLNFLANYAVNSKLEDKLDAQWFEDVSFI